MLNPDPKLQSCEDQNQWTLPMNAGLYLRHVAHEVNAEEYGCG